MIVISKANKESRPKESGEECFNLQLLRKKSKEQKGESPLLCLLSASLFLLSPTPLLTHGSCMQVAVQQVRRQQQEHIRFVLATAQLGPILLPPPPLHQGVLLLLLIKTTHFDKRAKGTTQVQLRSRSRRLSRRSSCSQFQASTA